MLVCDMSRPKNDFLMMKWILEKKKKRSRIVQCVFFQNICDVISIRNIYLFIYFYFSIYLFFSKKVTYLLLIKNIFFHILIFQSIQYFLRGDKAQGNLFLLFSKVLMRCWYKQPLRNWDRSKKELL